MAKRNGNVKMTTNTGGFRIWEDSAAGQSGYNQADSSPVKVKRLPLRSLAVSNLPGPIGFTKLKLGSSSSQPISQPRKLSDSTCEQSFNQKSAVQNFAIFCDDQQLTVDKLADQSQYKDVFVDNKPPEVSRLSRKAECCQLPSSSELRTGNSQAFGDLSLDKENIADVIDSLPEKLTAAPRRVLASRQPLGQLSFNSSAAESVEDEYGAEDSVFEEDDGRASQSSEYESVASTHYYTPRAQLERESHADLIYGCPEYAESIYAYLREREVLMRPKWYYMKKQGDINETMRSILVDWLLEVAIEYNLEEETYFLAISYVDRFLSVMSVTRTKLQLVGTAAMFIASKFEEIYPPDIKEFVYITDDSYTKSQVTKMEQMILDSLNFDMALPTVHCFLTVFSKAMKCDRQTAFLANYLCQLAILDISYLQYLPSQIAASAVCLANIVVGEVPWSETIENLSGYTVSDFYECMEKLLETFKRAPDSPQQAARERYSNTKYFQVATLSPPLTLPPID